MHGLPIVMNFRISIHASRRVVVIVIVDDNFNPRLPRGRRLVALLVAVDVGHISIHASLAGGD